MRYQDLKGSQDGKEDRPRVAYSNRPYQSVKSLVIYEDRTKNSTSLNEFLSYIGLLKPQGPLPEQTEAFIKRLMMSKSNYKTLDFNYFYAGPSFPW